jgi:hypothetical protein
MERVTLEYMFQAFMDVTGFQLEGDEEADVVY